MATNNNQTPKVQKRSGRFIRSLLNGNTNHSSNSNTLINFRHLISVCHNSSSTIPIPSSNSPYNRSYSSNSTPATPNMRRYRTLTFHFPFDECNPSTPLIPTEKPPRSMNTLSSINTNNNNNDNTTISSTISTPSIDRSSTRKLDILF
ncbi:unnamed protein product [Rotaria sp. Silwood2]|nr:unnamed protein product [Rotaria sp. Silwood2]